MNLFIALSVQYCWHAKPLLPKLRPILEAMLQIFGLATEIELYWHRKPRNKKKKTVTLGTIMQREMWLNPMLLVLLSI